MQNMEHMDFIGKNGYVAMTENARMGELKVEGFGHQLVEDVEDASKKGELPTTDIHMFHQEIEKSWTHLPGELPTTDIHKFHQEIDIVDSPSEFGFEGTCGAFEIWFGIIS